MRALQRATGALTGPRIYSASCELSLRYSRGTSSQKLKANGKDIETCCCAWNVNGLKNPGGTNFDFLARYFWNALWQKCLLNNDITCKLATSEPDVTGNQQKVVSVSEELGPDPVWHPSASASAEAIGQAVAYCPHHSHSSTFHNQMNESTASSTLSLPRSHQHNTTFVPMPSIVDMSSIQQRENPDLMAAPLSSFVNISSILPDPVLNDPVLPQNMSTSKVESSDMNKDELISEEIGPCSFEDSTDITWNHLP